METTMISDSELLEEIDRRFDEKKALIHEMEFMTKKLLKLNEENQKTQEVKSRFLSLIKNEFNNPMSSLLNLVNMMVKKVDDPDLLKLSGLMRAELLRLDLILKNIFSASEIEAGEIANDFSKVVVNDIFEEVIAAFSHLIEEKSLDVRYIARCDDTIISDPKKLNLILLNLMSNACEYSYENAQIIVTVQRNKDDIILSVEDSGEGVSHDHSKEIYTRFSHFESGATRRTAGLGLGLSVTRGFVESLDGSIDYLTKEGTTLFTVTLPVIDDKGLDLSTGFGSNEFIFDSSEGVAEF